MTETLIIDSPKILSINDTNDIFVTLNICVLTNKKNYNLAMFSKNYIDGVVDNKDKYIGLPFVVNREKLESKEGKLTHELSEGVLGTDVIGSFVNLWQETKDDVMHLMAEIRIPKRFPKTCEAIVELYENGGLSTSCEALIREYAEIAEDGVRTIDYNDGKNPLIGSCIVDDPAEPLAVATLLVAEAYEKDIQAGKSGDHNMPENIKYNNGIKVKYHDQVETASLKYQDIEKSIYNTLNPVDVENGGRTYSYYIYEIYNDKVIVLDDNARGEVLYSVGYRIENDTVVLDKKEDWKKGSFQFVPEGVIVNSLITDQEIELAEISKELTKAKEELQIMSKEKVTELELSEDEVSKLKAKIEKLEGEIKELKAKIAGSNETAVAEKEAKTALEGTITELNSQVEELTTYKTNFEKAEKETKVTELNARYSKLISEEMFKSEEVVNAIQELNEASLNAIVVSEIAKEKEAIETAAKDQVEVVTSAAKVEDLIEPDARDYLLSARA